MKALSIKQPWLHAILHHGKDVENRGWSTSYRGPIALHASKNVDKEGDRYLLESGLIDASDWRNAVWPTGAILGTAQLVDVVADSDSPWFFGPFGFVLADVRPLVQPVPCRGRLHLWTPPADVLAQIAHERAG